MARSLNRRSFLRGTGVAMALPFLDAMRPALGGQSAETAIPRRMVAIETNMGILPQFFFPEQAGRDYASSPYLERLAGAPRPDDGVFRRQFSRSDRRRTRRKDVFSPARRIQNAADSATGFRSISSPPSKSATRRDFPRWSWR